MHCRADKYTCTQLDRLARDYLRRNFETVVKCDGRPPNRVGLVNLSQTALMQILTDDSLELSSEVHPHLMHSSSTLFLGSTEFCQVFLGVHVCSVSFNADTCFRVHMVKLVVNARLCMCFGGVKVSCKAKTQR